MTRERPDIDGIASAWFIRRFVDRDAVIHFVSSQWVNEAAAELDATPFGTVDAMFAPAGDGSSFDAFWRGPASAIGAATARSDCPRRRHGAPRFRPASGGPARHVVGPVGDRG